MPKTITEETQNHKEAKPSFLLEAYFADDPKWVEIRLEHGDETCFLCLLLICRMRVADDFSLEVNPKVLAYQLRSTEEKVSLAIDAGCNSGLFAHVNGSVTAPGLQKRMQAYTDRKEKLRQSGREAALKRWHGEPKDESCEPNRSPMGNLCEPICEPNATAMGSDGFLKEIRKKININLTRIEDNKEEERKKEERSIDQKTVQLDLVPEKPGSRVQQSKEKPHPTLKAGMLISGTEKPFRVPDKYLTEPCLEAIQSWLDWKAESKPYRGLTGMKSMFTQVGMCKATPEFFAWAIHYAIQHAHEGIHFDFTQEKYFQATGQSPKQGEKFWRSANGGVHSEKNDLDREKVYKLARERGHNV